MYKKIISSLLVMILICSPIMMPSFYADNEKATTKATEKAVEKTTEKTTEKATKADDEKDEKNKKASEREKAEKAYNEQLLKNREEIQAKEQYKAELVKNIEEIGKQIRSSHAKIAKLDKKIYAKQKAVNDSKKQIETQMNALKKRVRAIYMAGDISSLEIILGARDFSDFIDKVELVRTLANYDQTLINKLKTKLDKIAVEKKALLKIKAKRKKSEKVLNKKQSELSKTLKENEKILKSLYDVQKTYQQRASYTRGGTGSGSGSSGAIHVSRTGYTWPVPSYYYVISPFGENRGYTHKGIDITGGGILGARVVAAYDGVVTASNNSCVHNWGKSGSCGCGGGYGNFVQINHGNGKQTLYGHLSDAVVTTGTKVRRGETIGYVGTTGWSTGPHLHFECKYGGIVYNPMREF